MDFDELIRQDFELLSKSTELDVAKESEDAILMQSVEGHAHNGAGMFHKRRFVNITVTDIVTAFPGASLSKVSRVTLSFSWILS